jgi:acyl dehydratase
MIEYPKTLEEWDGFEIKQVSKIKVDQNLIDIWLEAMRDGNPLYWNEAIAKEICGGIIAPPTSTLTFAASYRWTPERPDEMWDMHGVEVGFKKSLRLPMEPHFALKDFTGLKEGIVGGIDAEYYEPMRLGDNLTMYARVRDISDLRTNKLGTGRNWIAEAEYRNQRDELVSIERYKFYCYNREA